MIYKQLKRLAQDFKLANEQSLTSVTLLAIAAITGNTDIKADISYSSIMRGLRANKSSKLKPFMIEFKKAFDNAYVADLEDIETIALMQAMQKVDLKEEDYE